MPPATDVEALLELSVELADAADNVSLRHFGGRVAATLKTDGSPVTEADTEVEAAIRGLLAQRAPEMPILGEEEGGELDPGAATWVIDPIDATANFMRGIPVYATLIAVVVGGEAVVGTASAPAMGERWTAAKGHGTRRNGEPVSVSTVTNLADGQVLHGGLDWWRSSPSAWEALGALTNASARMRGFGDFWMHLLVAGGMAEAAIERDLKPWDVAAVECIVREAGGRITSYDGGSALASGEAVSTNGLVHDEVLNILANI